MRSSNEAPNVKLSTVATFPKNYFLENLAVRSDNSVLVTVLNHKELWYVPSSNDEQIVEPELLFTFPQPAIDRNGGVEVAMSCMELFRCGCQEGRIQTVLLILHLY